MITLDIYDYCHDCLDFSPDVEKPHRVELFDRDSWSDTVIRCSNRNRCESIKRYLSKKCKEESK